MRELALYLHPYKSNRKNSQDFILTKKVYQETFRKKELQGTSHLYCKLRVTVVNIAQLRLSCWRLHLEKVSVVARLIWLSLCDICTYSMFTCSCLFFLIKCLLGCAHCIVLCHTLGFQPALPVTFHLCFFFLRGMFFWENTILLHRISKCIFSEAIFFCLHQTQICFVSENVLRYFRYL